MKGKSVRRGRELRRYGGWLIARGCVALLGLSAGWLVLGVLTNVLGRRLGFLAQVIGYFLSNFIGFIGLAVLSSAAAASVHRGRRLRAISRATSARRPAVVYLRPFVLDERLARRSHEDLGLNTSTLTVEEHLMQAFQPIGTVGAIARPGEPVPHLGPDLRDVPEDEWQAETLDMVAHARLVLLGAGVGAGFLWEVENVVRVRQPEDLLIVVPLGAAGYEAFRALAAPLFPRSLPPYPPDESGRRPPIKGVVQFEPDWTPRFTRFDVWPRDAAGKTFGSTVACCHYWLRPVYEHHGVRLRPVWRIPYPAFRKRRLYIITASQRRDLYSVVVFFFVWVVLLLALFLVGLVSGGVHAPW